MVEFSADFPFKRRSTDRAVPASPPAPAADNTPPPPPAPAKPIAPVELTAETPAEQPLTSAPPQKPAIERRKFKRERMAAPGLIHVDGAKGPPAKVTLIDISIAGARFSSQQPLDVGDKLQIRVEAGPFRWTTRMRVIHCTRHPAGPALIGCAFLRTELLRPWPVAA
jgi:hypothetical protein